ncbi:MAG: orotidine 5'-phosphate decarboxylase [Candidatus Aenigmarchaeota archaeon]|nr:orotidine 5'-phosphate decarboxylase [Candidatus Aenigmarchaeota archaeon]
MDKRLKNPPGIVPAMDMPLGKALMEMYQLNNLTNEITGFKIGSEIRDGYGYSTMRRVLDEADIRMPTIFDGQKDGCDVPDFIVGQVERVAKDGKFDSYIGSPLGAGSNVINLDLNEGYKQGSLEAFVNTCYEQNIVPIIVLEMTQPGAIRYSSHEQCEELARDAIDLGVRYFVAPANKPERLEVYRKIIDDGEIVSPGAGPQKTGNVFKDAESAISSGADHLVIGRGIFNSDNPEQITKELYGGILEAYDAR